MNKLVFNFPNTLVLIAIIYGLVFAGILLSRNWRKKNAHFWLGIFMLVFSATLLDTYLKMIHLERLFSPINWTYYRLLVLIPYTIWIYVSILVTGQFVIKRFEKILLVCLMIEAMFRSYMFTVLATGDLEWGKYLDIVVDNWLELFIIIISITTLFKSLCLVNNYQKKLANNYSAKTEKELKWLKELVVVLLTVIIVWIIVVPVDFLLEDIFIPSYWIFLPQALVIYYLGIKGHLQPEIFHEFPLVPSFEKNQFLEQEPNKPIQNNVQEIQVTDEAIQIQLKQIEKVIQEDKIYRQPKLSLQDMAKKLNMSTRQLSNLINQHYQYSFSDFINFHRVAEIKARIIARDDEKFTLLAIALEAGFNSKSSFNHMFKKFTGQTPMQFKKMIKS